MHDDAGPQVIIIAGPNGAGKTTLAPFLLRDTYGLLEYVNADTLALGLSAFNPAGVAFDAGRIMLKRLRELAAQRVSLAFETTLASRSYARWLASLRQRGYEIHLFYLWLVSADLALQPVRERVRQGGHDVPEEIVRRRYVGVMSAAREISSGCINHWLIRGACTTIPTPPRSTSPSGGEKRLQRSYKSISGNDSV